MDIAEQLRSDGIGKGLCRLWQGKLTPGLGVKDLADLYKRGIDFCISEDYPTLDFLRENFKGKCEDFGVYIDDEVDAINQDQVVLNGACRAVLAYDGYSVSRVYARHGAEVAINACDSAWVTVDAFDDARIVVAVAGKDAHVSVNLYGDASVECLGDGITINRKNKRTY